MIALHAGLGVGDGQRAGALNIKNEALASVLQSHDKVAAGFQHGMQESEVDKVAVGKVDPIPLERAGKGRRFAALILAINLGPEWHERQHVQVQIQANLPANMAVASAMGQSPQHVGGDAEVAAVDGAYPLFERQEILEIPMRTTRRQTLQQLPQQRQERGGGQLVHGIGDRALGQTQIPKRLPH